MKLLFVHDVKAEEFNDDIFARSYGYEIWKERYLTTFNTIRVCFRLKHSEVDLNGILDKSSGPNVYFERRIGMFKGPDVFFSKRIKKILRENIEDSDTVIVRLDSFMGLQTICECKKKNKPYMIELVGCAWDSFWNHGITGKILAPYLFYRTRCEVKKAPFVVYVTSEFLQKRYPNNGINTNISNVKLERQNKENLENRILKIRNQTNKKIILGTAANIDVKYKGQRFVIEALGILKKRGYSNFEYQILGAGNSDYLEKIIKKNNVKDQVKIIGSLPHNKVFNWLKEEVDIYIQPSLQEGLPRALIEAMSVGLPCIGSDVAGIPELLDTKYIFKRKKNIPIQIAKLLADITINDLERESIRNYNEAKKYSYEFLIEKRKNYLNEFKKYVNKK